MREWWRRTRTELDPRRTFFVNVDTVGKGSARYVTAEGFLLLFRHDQRLIDLCRRIGRREEEPAAKPSRPWRLGDASRPPIRDRRLGSGDARLSLDHDLLHGRARAAAELSPAIRRAGADRPRWRSRRRSTWSRRSSAASAHSCRDRRPSPMTAPRKAARQRRVADPRGLVVARPKRGKPSQNAKTPRLGQRGAFASRRISHVCRGIVRARPSSVDSQHPAYVPDVSFISAILPDSFIPHRAEIERVLKAGLILRCRIYCKLRLSDGRDRVPPARENSLSFAS